MGKTEQMSNDAMQAHVGCAGIDLAAHGNPAPDPANDVFADIKVGQVFVPVTAGSPMLVSELHKDKRHVYGRFVGSAQWVDIKTMREEKYVRVVPPAPVRVKDESFWECSADAAGWLRCQTPLKCHIDVGAKGISPRFYRVRYNGGFVGEPLAGSIHVFNDDPYLRNDGQQKCLNCGQTARDTFCRPVKDWRLKDEKAIAEEMAGNDRWNASDAPPAPRPTFEGYRQSHAFMHSTAGAIVGGVFSQRDES